MALRICVIGSGIAGLSVSHYLAQLVNMEVTLVERAPHPGGRAAVSAGGEHCPRVFLDDYRYVFDILRSIPLPDGRNVRDVVRKVVRHCHTDAGGWVPISHLYRFHSREIPFQERLRLAGAMLRTPLVAESALNANRYGSLRNYSLTSLARVSLNLWWSRDGNALDGSTDEILVRPWLDHLVRHGVRFRPSTPAEGISSHRDGALVRIGGIWEEYDAAVVTAYLPDVLALLPPSPTAHARAALPHSHCACLLTVTLDPREELIVRGEVALCFRFSLAVLVQPAARRCIVMCLRPRSTETGWVLQRLREMLDLHHDLADVQIRDNQSPNQSVYTAEPLRADEVLPDGWEHVYLAGSYLRSRYPLDSAECAARTAFTAVERVASRYGFTPPATPAASLALVP